MASRWPEWIGDATTPSDTETSELDSFAPQPLRDAVIDATSPTDEELASLLARRPWAATRRSRTPWMVGSVGLVMATAALVWVAVPAQTVVGPVAYGTVATTLHEPVAVSDGVMHLGPSIDMTGDGLVVVDQASEAGTEVTLVEGRVHFDVDPEGAWRDLAIDADGVMVRVHGTIFDVVRDGDDVRVEVERGRVSVRWQGEEVFVTGGNAWSRPEPDVAVVVDSSAEQGIADAEPVALPEEPVRQSPAAPAVEERAEGIAAVPEEEPDVVDEPVWRVTEGTADHELAQILALKSTGLAADALLAETDQVLARHRGSGVSMEIELVRLQTLAQVDPALASLEMGQWLDAHPGASRAPLVRFERAQVTHRALGRCASALGDYRSVAERDDDLGARAAAGAGLCALELGSTSAAVRYLDQALAHGLQGTLLAEVRAARATLEE